LLHAAVEAYNPIVRFKSV